MWTPWKRVCFPKKAVGRRHQDFEFWHFFHEDQIQPVVFGIRFRAELKAATLVGEVHGSGEKHGRDFDDGRLVQNELCLRTVGEEEFL